MKLTSEDIAGVEVVKIAAAHLDGDNVAEFTRQIEPLLGCSERILLDMADLGFVDSSGLGAILDLLRTLEGEEATLKICRPSPVVRSVMRMVGMQRLVPTFETREDALASFGA